jgi:hypothetical protein
MEVCFLHRIFFFIYSTGVFIIRGKTSLSSINNCSFKNLTPLYEDGRGSALYINITNYSSFVIDYCIFAQCGGYFGVLNLFLNPYIIITHTRFENNSAFYGSDIHVEISPCFNDAAKNSIASSVCSTSFPSNERLYCDNKHVDDQLQNSCSSEVVCCFLHCFF